MQLVWIQADHLAPCGLVCEKVLLDRGHEPLRGEDSCCGAMGSCAYCRRDRRRRGVATLDDMDGFTDPGLQLSFSGL